MNRFTVNPEQARERNEESPLNRIIDGSEDLEEIEKAYKLLEKQNDNELHSIRKKHLKQLFILTCVWSGLVVFVLISNGLKRLWWFPTLPYLEVLKFELDNSVMIAFITSTTATIIGLYTIAAYWLFKKKD